MSDLEQSEPSDRTTDSPRTAARKHIEKRRGLQAGMVAYVVVNAFLVAIWAMTGGGYFWPGWVIAGWGVGMAFALWDYIRGPISDADIDDELRRMRR
jgi:2TM domain